MSQGESGGSDRDQSNAGMTMTTGSILPPADGHARLDPITLIQQRQKLLRLPLRSWVIPFAVVGGVAGLFFALSIILDALGSLGDDRFTLAGLRNSLFTQDVEQARNTLGSLGEVMAAVLGLALTVSSIIVQLAATRFTPIVTSMFFRSRTNAIVLSFFVVCNVFVLWVNFSVGEGSVPRWGVFLSMVLLTASLLLLFPYFAYVFNFLEPDSIISRITTDGLASSTPYRGRRRRSIGSRQREATQASSTSPTSASTPSSKRTRTSPRVRPTRCATSPFITATPRPAWSRAGTRSPSGTARAPTS
ncbi:MAG: DUF2254 domain-containing protein [Deltaproteobacteria bacterium]|nr:DUF2254 domain-containing protein [Deltaproteobacteria bacterium]